MFEIEFSKNFAKNLDKLPTNIVKRFYDDLKNITQNPYPSNEAVDVKKLQGDINK
ncbi:MAG TPA: hypothetical protein PKW30_02650 [Campylobacterales bacterium]|nr:hypothetical protein [Campylobacterales bacterium]